MDAAARPRISHHRAMSTPQSGIFALGTASHAYLELDARQGRAGQELVGAVASLREPRTTMGGVNLVAGFRPELWREIVPDDAPARLEGFNHAGRAGGYTMPATQHDAVLWLSGAPTTSSSTPHAPRSGPWQESPPSLTRPPAGRTSTTATSPASSTAAKPGLIDAAELATISGPPGSGAEVEKCPPGNRSLSGSRSR